LKEILFFSNNKDKVREINKLFKTVEIKVYYPKDFGVSYEPKELGESFAENAKIKSFFGYKKINLPCFADDSGICIEALDWKPGILSKKFINGFKNKNECFNYIINKVEKTGKKRAYFQTSICYTIKDNYHIVFEGRVYGKISDKFIGNMGFGFDPIFIPNGYIKTFAELEVKEKNTLSHRSVAVNKLINFLTN